MRMSLGGPESEPRNRKRAFRGWSGKCSRNRCSPRRDTRGRSDAILPRSLERSAAGPIPLVTSCMSVELVFVDTNVLVYARDARYPDKQQRAEDWMARLWRQRTGRLSVQVLQEYYVSVTQRLKPGMD